MNDDPKILPGTGRWQACEAGLTEGPPSTTPADAGAVPLPVSGRNSSLSVRAQFPAIENWHYLDSAATAQKPQAVIDAITEAYARDYATVHRGVYQRSSEMTGRYEAARAAASNLIGGQPDELVFTRGATEAINLVARTLPKNGRNRVLLSQLEHHSNIVPWQLAGYEVDAVPLTREGRIDLDAAEQMLTEEHRVVAFAHVSNVLGSVLDAKRAAEIAHGKGALLLLDGCQAVPRMPVDVAQIGADFYAYSAHKLYGPTGIGALWARTELLQSLPPWQGGGSMIDRVTFEKTTYLDAPARFEAGTPHIVGAVGLHAAVNWVEKLGLDAIHAHECALALEAREALRSMQGMTLYGPEDSAGIVSFNVDGVHAHDTATILDDAGVAVRAGHHCAQPLMEWLGVDATARASFGVYNGRRDVEALLGGIERVTRIFG
jgi:cysteine desulfurase / selenocysteine lyase